jgi:hypothetical protein
MCKWGRFPALSRWVADLAAKHPDEYVFAEAGCSTPKAFHSKAQGRPLEADYSGSGRIDSFYPERVAPLRSHCSTFSG